MIDSKLNIIGIAGKARAGKDTVGELLVEKGFVKINLADPIKRALREIFDFSDKQLWGELKEQPDIRYPRKLPNHTLKRSGDIYVCKNCYRQWSPYEACYSLCDFFLTPRHAMQQLGTEMGRACYENVWIDYAMRAAAEILKGAHRHEDGGMWAPVYNRTFGLKFYCGDSDNFPTAKGVIICDVRFENEARAIKMAGGRVWMMTRPGVGLESDHASEMVDIPQSLIDATIENDSSLEALGQKVEALL